MKRGDALLVVTLRDAFEQFLEGSSFAQRTRESYTEDLAPLLSVCGQAPITTLTVEVVHTFLARQETLAPATYNRCLAALRSFIRWLRTQGWQIEEILEKVERKPEGKQTPRALDAQRVESLLRQITSPRNRALFYRSQCIIESSNFLVKGLEKMASLFSKVSVRRGNQRCISPTSVTDSPKTRKTRIINP